MGWNTAKDLIEKGDIFFVAEGEDFIAKRKFPEGNVTESAVSSLLIDKGTASTGTKELKQIFGQKVFDTTKPLDVTEFLIDLSMFNKDEGFVLDFFAGSGTTGEAVLEYNRKQNKNLNFILCTNNEMKEDIRNNLLQRGVSEDSEEYLEEGVCRKVTYPKLKSVIQGYEYVGKIVDIIDETKLTVSSIKNVQKTLDKWEEVKGIEQDKYDKIKNRVKGDKFQLIGERDITGEKEGNPANLKYFMTEMIEKNPNIDQMKITMSKRIYDLLCMKENCFELIEEQSEYRIYKQGDLLMGVYTDFMNLFFDEFKEKLMSYDSPEKIIYSFSFTDYIDESLLDDIKDSIKIKPIPNKMIKMLDELRK